MNQDQFLLYDHKKQIKIKVERVTFYLQGQIVEAFSEENEVYYLFFYKYQFLTAAKAIKLRRQSYIEHAFKKGMVFESPHPFINILLSSNHPYQMINFNQLLKKLDHYTPQEKAFILTFFESLIPKKHLFNQIISVYYECRRNGQYFSGYRIIRILMDFAPKNSLVKSLANDMIFNEYAFMYNQKSEELFTKDLIFAEETLYSQKENDKCFHQLVDLLEKESRWMDLIALYIHKLTLTPSFDCYIHLLKLLDQHLKENEALYILEKVYCQIPTFLPLQKDLFNKYIKKHSINNVFNMIHSHGINVNDSSQIHTIGGMLEQLDLDTHTLQPEILNTLLKQYINLFPQKAEKLLNKFVISLLKTHELSYIQKWLVPFKDNHDNLQIIGKIDTMQKLYDDPDQMQTLGELYYEFKQLDKAIECFSWEMELKPTSPKPLQWLAKIYRDKGMNYESDAYQQLCIQLQKRA
jgi:tetratricopeptide (TPR) repeat protein